MNWLKLLFRLEWLFNIAPKRNLLRIIVLDCFKFVLFLIYLLIYLIYFILIAWYLNPSWNFSSFILKNPVHIFNFYFIIAYLISSFHFLLKMLFYLVFVLIYQILIIFFLSLLIYRRKCMGILSLLKLCFQILNFPS